MIQCKFECQSIQEHKDHYTYNLTPVYGSELNKEYWEATPAGSLQLTIIKTKGKLFNVGREYFLDILDIGGF